MDYMGEHNLMPSKNSSFHHGTLYVYIALIVPFFAATNQYRLEQNPNLEWACSLIPFALVVLLFVLHELWGGR